jgi:hypothetical protein
MKHPLIPAKAGTQVFFVAEARRSTEPQDLTTKRTKHTKHTKGSERAQTLEPIAASWCAWCAWWLKKAWVPAFAGMSGK